MVGPFVSTEQPKISLSPTPLPVYALRTTMRMLAALVASLIFTIRTSACCSKLPHLLVFSDQFSAWF